MGAMSSEAVARRPTVSAISLPSRSESGDESRSGMKSPSTRSLPRARAQSAATTELSTPPDKPTTAPRRCKGGNTRARIGSSIRAHSPDAAPGKTPRQTPPRPPALPGATAISRPRRYGQMPAAGRGGQPPAGKVPQAVVTFAANIRAPPGPSVAAAGKTATLRTRSGATLTVIAAAWVTSACACAVTTHVPDPRKDVNAPEVVIVPQSAGTLQIIAVSPEPVTVAFNAVCSQAKALTGEVAAMRTPLSTVTMAWALAA